MAQPAGQTHRALHLLLVIAMTALAWLPASSAARADGQFVSLGTGPFSGVYYPTGQAICDIVNATGKQLRCSVGATPGSVYNVEALSSGEDEFALMQSDVQYLSVHGEGRWKDSPEGTLRAVMSLYPELVTLVARRDAGIGSIAEIKGKRINIGAPGSGTRATWEVLKAALGITEADLAEAAELKPEAAAERMCANSLDASLLIVGHPSKLVSTQLQSCGLTLVPVTGSGIDALVASKPYYVAEAIPAAAYGLAADTPSFGGKTTLMTTADVPDDVVYAVTMAIMKNLEKLRRMPTLVGLQPEEMASQSLTAPIHPGALRAYRELGLVK
jgi:TRAP transporter TAXI family solute receptor